MEVDTKDEEAKEEDTVMKETDVNAVSSPKELQNALYVRCASHGEENHVFSQEELMSFGIIPNNSLEKLLVFTKQLAKDGLLRLMQKDGRACWRVIKKDDAAKYKSLSPDEALVYSYVESAGREGIWSKFLRNRTNLPMTTVNRATKVLESRNMIKPFKSMKYPSRKVFILAKLQPSEDVTGGPFYTDGALDTEFIRELSLWTERYVIGRSWGHPTSDANGQRKSQPKLNQREAEELRAKEMKTKAIGRDRSRGMLPMPHGYKGYPTNSEITEAMNASGISGVVMKTTEMQQLIDILCWDGRLEKVRGGKAYRAARTIAYGQGINGLTEAPCGRCPVFELCEEDGPVNAVTCEYFQDWLQF